MCTFSLCFVLLFNHNQLIDVAKVLYYANVMLMCSITIALFGYWNASNFSQEVATIDTNAHIYYICSFNGNLTWRRHNRLVSLPLQVNHLVLRRHNICMLSTIIRRLVNQVGLNHVNCLKILLKSNGYHIEMGNYGWWCTVIENVASTPRKQYSVFILFYMYRSLYMLHVRGCHYLAMMPITLKQNLKWYNRQQTRNNELITK